MEEITPLSALHDCIEATADSLLTMSALWIMMSSDVLPTEEACKTVALLAIDEVLTRTRIEGAKPR